MGVGQFLLEMPTGNPRRNLAGRFIEEPVNRLRGIDEMEWYTLWIMGGPSLV